MAIDDDSAPGKFSPPSASVRVAFGAQSTQGTVSPQNDDHYLIIELGRHQETVLTSLPETVVGKRFDEKGYAMVVADGVGSAGQEASRLALETLMHLVLHFGKWNLRFDNEIADEVMNRAMRFYRHVDSTLAYRGRDRPLSLQTSMTAVFGAGTDLFFAHVGHSRAYLFRRGKLMRMTHDHTLGSDPHRTKLPVAPLVNVNAAARDLQHILTETIGMSGPVGPTVDLERFQIDDGDVVLVCTNGLTDAVEEDGIAGVLASDRPPQEQCGRLAELASGGEDDMTVLVAHYDVSA
jgi:serine/threonine protein phosphatase PrpC